MGERLVPAREARREIKIINSRFIAAAGPAMSTDSAKTFISRMRQEYPDATHHVPAFLIGHGNSVVTHCHDDGEPAGTAGRPALAVLQGSGLGDVVVVVIRYFGGTKLGTGGLVRAYGDAVRGVLEIMPKARKLAAHSIRFAVPYAGFERVCRLIAAHHGQLKDREFGVVVTVKARLPVTDFDAFQTALRNAMNSSMELEILDTDPNALWPLEPS